MNDSDLFLVGWFTSTQSEWRLIKWTSCITNEISAELSHTLCNIESMFNQCLRQSTLYKFILYLKLTLSKIFEINTKFLSIKTIFGVAIIIWANGTKVWYSGIIFICGGQCWWVATLFMVRWDVSSWRYKFVGKNNHKKPKRLAPTNNDDSIVFQNMEFDDDIFTDK